MKFLQIGPDTARKSPERASNAHHAPTLRVSQGSRSWRHVRSLWAFQIGDFAQPANLKRAQSAGEPQRQPRAFKNGARAALLGPWLSSIAALTPPFAILVPRSALARCRPGLDHRSAGLARRFLRIFLHASLAQAILVSTQLARSLLGAAPTFIAATSPPLNSSRVGMPRTYYFIGVSPHYMAGDSQSQYGPAKIFYAVAPPSASAIRTLAAAAPPPPLAGDA